MIDPLVQLQSEITARLDYESAFQYLCVKSYRAHVISAEIDKKLPHLAGKNGRVGCGILVGIPTLEGVDPNVSTAQSEILLPIDVIALPEINNDPGVGTLIEPESAARSVRANLHAWGNCGLVFLYQDKLAISPIEGLEQSHPGCIGYRVLLRGRLNESTPAKLSNPAISDDGACVFTLSDPGEGAQIIYTLDGSQPVPEISGQINPSAYIYFKRLRM